MSDIIPPLISSTPPPMPEFDDEEDDDDDDDFGMGTGISDLGIDFQDTTLRETKDKGLELERNGRVGGSQDGWRSNEEQDSASQDSGLCMASHGSEGVSPLPQSDDDERATEMRHSATVIFDDKQHQPHPSATNGINPNDDEDRSDDEFGNWTVADNFTQQTEDNHSCNTQSDKISQPPKQTKDIEACNGSIPNGLLNHSANDEQFESTNISKTASNDIQSMNYRCVERDIQSEEDRCVETINDTHSNGLKEDVSTKSVGGNASNDIQSLDHRCVETTNEIHPNDLKEGMSTKSVAGKCVDNVHLNGSLVDDTTVSVDNNCVDSVIESNLETSDENNHCADGTHSQTQFNCVDDLSDSDDFGNFESVTIVNHNLNCVDSVEKQVETNSQAVDDDSFGDFSEFSEPVIVDSKLNSNEISVNDVRVVETTEEGPSLESNLDSSKSVSLDNSVCQRSSENSTEDPIKCEESHHPDVSGENDDDEFNDFSDFTQSQAVENTADDDEFDEFSDFTQSQAVEGGVDQVKADSVDCGSHTISSQGGFEDIFPREGAETDDAKTEDLEKGAIWQQLCPLESSPALRFQWPNSRAHTKLLSALNIDSRNILFGPKWNAKIPRFAANLGSNPLQPVKASERSSANAPTPTNNLPSEMTLQNEPETVPDAHFDWGSSGLTNPLDYAHRTTAHKSEETMDNNSSKRRNKLDNLKVLSGEAEKIISQLPDLNFMKKTYIEVLISKV